MLCRYREIIEPTFLSLHSIKVLDLSETIYALLMLLFQKPKYCQCLKKFWVTSLA